MGLFKKEIPEQVTVCGLMLRCEICKNDLFWSRAAQMNTAVATFFSLDWVNPTADCFVCANCGYVHWFLPV